MKSYEELYLSHSKQMLFYYTPWKLWETCDFRMFWGGIEKEDWLKIS